MSCKKQGKRLPNWTCKSAESSFTVPRFPKWNQHASSSDYQGVCRVPVKIGGMPTTASKFSPNKSNKWFWPKLFNLFLHKKKKSVMTVVELPCDRHERAFIKPSFGAPLSQSYGSKQHYRTKINCLLTWLKIPTKAFALYLHGKESKQKMITCRGNQILPTLLPKRQHESNAYFSVLDLLR